VLTTYTELGFLVIVELENLTADEFISFFRENNLGFEEQLQINGAIKFKGVQIDSIETFQHIISAIGTKFLDYIDGTSPRTKMLNNIYSSTEYNKSKKIAMHNELSYSAKWPGKLFFSCLQPADTGGETFLADSREMLRRMNSDIVAEIEERGITYIRNLPSENGMGVSWQKAFETSDRKQLEKYCSSYGIDIEWKNDDSVRLKQNSKGIITHRTSKERVWFNQIDQFHPCQLGEELYKALISIYDVPEEFPTYVRFGDGQPISEVIVKEIIKTSDEITIAPVWQRNELLIVDNELVSHGRNSYTGNRSVIVAMSE